MTSSAAKLVSSGPEETFTNASSLTYVPFRGQVSRNTLTCPPKHTSMCISPSANMGHVHRHVSFGNTWTEPGHKHAMPPLTSLTRLFTSSALSSSESLLRWSCADAPTHRACGHKELPQGIARIQSIESRGGFTSCVHAVLCHSATAFSRRTFERNWIVSTQSASHLLIPTPGASLCPPRGRWRLLNSAAL